MRYRRCGRTRSALLALVLSGVLSSAAVAQQKLNFDIPAQPAAAAIQSWAQQSGLQVFAAEDDLRGIRTNAVQGDFAPVEAAQRLIAGTGLEVVATGENTVTIRRVRPAGTAASSGDEKFSSSVEPLMEVIVTGSRIKRPGFDTLQATVVTDSKDLEKRAYTNLGQALQNTPGFMLSDASAMSNVQGTQTVGQTFVNFFGLGSQRTLTLVNGRRYVSSNTASGRSSVPAVAALTEGVLKAMFLTKLKTVSAVCVAIGLFLGGAGVGVRYALAAKPGADGQKEAAAGQKQKKEQGPGVQGVVQAVDAGKGTITVTVRVEGTKQTEDKTFDLAKDAKVLLNNSLSKDQPAEEGKLTDLSAGTGVTLQLSADKKAVVAVAAQGPKLQGTVKQVDAANNTIIVMVKDGKSAAEKTVELAKGARIILSDGLKKGDAGQDGKLSDIAEGTPVGLWLSVDQKKALAVNVRGASVQGRVKGVDAGNNTITLTVKEDAQTVDRTYTLDKEARIDGKLTDLVADTPVVVQLSVFDKTKAVAVRVNEKNKKE